MITLLASITGFIGSMLPEILKIYNDRHTRKHELEVIDRQIAQGQHIDIVSLDKLTGAQCTAEQASLYATYNTGVCWVDALNGSVRPMLAYSFFSIYACVKLIQYKAIVSTAHVVEYVDIIWNVDDQAIFAGIISFYFGQRTFNKLRRQYK